MRGKETISHPISPINTLPFSLLQICVAIIWTMMTTELRWWRTKTTSVNKKFLLSVLYCHKTRTTKIGDLSLQLKNIKTRRSKLFNDIGKLASHPRRLKKFIEGCVYTQKELETDFNFRCSLTIKRAVFLDEIEVLFPLWNLSILN